MDSDTQFFDDVEKLHSNLNTIREKKKRKIIRKYQNANKIKADLKTIQIILYTLIGFGVVSFIILLVIGLHYAYLIINAGLVVFLVIYVKYLEFKDKKNLKKWNKRYQQYEKQKRHQRLTTLQIFFYSLLIVATITILILSMIGIDPIILLIVIGISLIYIYFDKDTGNEV